MLVFITYEYICYFMKESLSLDKLVAKKEKIDKRISILEHIAMLRSSKERGKESAKKKRLAKIFLSSNYKSVYTKNSFSMYEIYTIGGLAILNGLDKYKSTVQLASYNLILKQCHNTFFKNIIIRNGKNTYTVDRKIKKDIEERLHFVNGLFIRSMELIADSDIEELHTSGNFQFIKIRQNRIEDNHNKVINKLSS